MIQREQLLTTIADLLQPQLFSDYCPNGLQVEGKASIKKIITGVTASAALLDAAIKAKADAIIVHHGIFWKGELPNIIGMKRARIGQLIDNNINLLAYHLPLDCHLELGNNKQLAKILDLKVIQTYTIDQIPNLLWLGELSQAMTAQELSNFISQRLERTPQVIEPQISKPIKRLAWCTGGAQKYLDQAKEYGADAYLSGEISESTFHTAQELNICYFAAGHHATERYGVQALGQYLADKLQIEHEFIDIANPV